MTLGRFCIAAVTLSLLTASATSPEAHAAHASSKHRTRVRHAEKKKSSRSSKRSDVKRIGRYFRGHGVSADELRTAPVSRPSGDLWVYAENFREEIRVNIYGHGAGAGAVPASTLPISAEVAAAPDAADARDEIGKGDYDDEALARLDHVFRCKRTGEQRAVDPRLYEVMSVISDHFGGKRIELVSGFRFQEGESSRHYHASAMDIRIVGVSIREIYDFAQSLDRGGMGVGIYPRAGFVHVDFRAPGDASYRWTDKSPADSPSRTKRVSHRFKGKSNS